MPDETLKKFKHGLANEMQHILFEIRAIKQDIDLNKITPQEVLDRLSARIDVLTSYFTDRK